MKHVVAIFEIQGPGKNPLPLGEEFVRAAGKDEARAAAEKLVVDRQTHIVRASSFATDGKILVYVVKLKNKPKRKRYIAESRLAVKR